MHLRCNRSISILCATQFMVSVSHQTPTQTDSGIPEQATRHPSASIAVWRKLQQEKAHAQSSGCIFLPNASRPGTFFCFLLDPICSLIAPYTSNAGPTSESGIILACYSPRALRSQCVCPIAENLVRWQATGTTF